MSPASDEVDGEATMPLSFGNATAIGQLHVSFGTRRADAAGILRRNVRRLVP